MKKGILSIIFLGLSLPIILWGINRMGVDTPNIPFPENVSAKDSLGLIQYVQKIEGSWVDEHFANQTALGLNEESDGPDLLLDIRSANIKDDLLAIYVAEYCRAEEAAYLLFGFDGQKLIYKGAEWEGCFIDIARIDFMSITYKEMQGLPVLSFEAREVDHQNHQRVDLLRLPEEVAESGWHCSMQYHLMDILTKGNYTLYSPQFQELTLLEAFGSENLLEELSFFEAFHTAWPMYEEICVSAPFEVVVLGEIHPRGAMNVFGIEWNSSEIRLYETFVHEESEDGVFPLVKGELKVILIPKLHLPQPENF